MISRAEPFVLASLLSGYPGEGFEGSVATLMEEGGLATAFGAKAKEAFPMVAHGLQDWLKSDSIDDMRSEYIDIFDRGRSANPLYETEYGRARAMVKGNELVDIAAFYRAFGFELAGADGGVAEMLDHVSVELEFYALMLLKLEALTEAGDNEGVEIVKDAQRKFLNDHLARFIDAIGTRPGVTASERYSAIFRLCSAVVQDECDRLGLEVDKAQWVEGQIEKPEILCGSQGGPCSV